ncbi:hypothetical protein QTN25_007891 [Entamoeba marina]
MLLRYKCIIIDHDDTTVNSTPTLHYESYAQFMKENKQEEPISIQEWYSQIWGLNMSVFLVEKLKLSEEDLPVINKKWYELFCNKTQEMFEGFYEMLVEFRKIGGIVCVCSHSETSVVKKFYEQYNNGKFIPDQIYGYDKNCPKKCKPYTYPIEDIMNKYHLDKESIVVIDDLDHGFNMAKKCGSRLYWSFIWRRT